MGPIDVYHPQKNRHRFSGGSFGGIYRTVIKRARNYMKSPEGRKLKKGIKRKILQIGSNAVNNMLSGQDSLQSLKLAKKKIKKGLSGPDLDSFKNSIVQKKGGVTLYQLKGRKGKRSKKKGRRKKKGNKRKKGKKKSKKKASLDTFYRLNSLQAQRRFKARKRRGFRKFRRKKVGKKKNQRNKKGSKKRGSKKYQKRSKKGGSQTVFDF